MTKKTIHRETFVIICRNVYPGKTTFVVEILNKCDGGNTMFAPAIVTGPFLGMITRLLLWFILPVMVTEFAIILLLPKAFKNFQKPISGLAVFGWFWIFIKFGLR